MNFLVAEHSKLGKPVGRVSWGGKLELRGMQEVWQSLNTLVLKTQRQAADSQYK